MRKLFVRVVIATVGLLACAACASFFVALSEFVAVQFTGNGPGWLGPLLGMITMAILTLLLSTFLRGAREWRIVDLLLGIVPIESATFFAISHLSGFDGSEILHPFNLEWFALLNLFVGLPWVIGILVGSLRRPAE